MPIKKFTSGLKHVSDNSVTGLRQIICSRKRRGPGRTHLVSDKINLMKFVLYLLRHRCTDTVHVALYRRRTTRIQYMPEHHQT